MARFRLARKTFGIAGALVGAKNWKALTTGVKTLKGGGTQTLTAGQRALEGAKGLGKASLTLGGTGALGVGALGGTAAYKAGGGDLISGGERSAEKMEFS